MESSSGSIVMDTLQFGTMPSEADKCMGEYMFYLDFKSDYYCITETQVRDFKLPAPGFCGTLGQFKSFIYKADYTLVEDELNQIMTGKKKKHNLKFRCASEEGEVIWIHSLGELVCDSDGLHNVLVGRMSAQKKKVEKCIRKKVKRLTEIEQDFHKLEKEKNHQAAMFLKMCVNDWGEMEEQYSGSLCENVYYNFYDAVCNVSNSIKDAEISVYQSGHGEVILVGISPTCRAVAQKVFEVVKQNKQEYHDECGNVLYYTVSAGYIGFVFGEAKYSDIIKKAEFVFKCARQSGMNQIAFFDSEMYEKHIRKLNIKEQMKFDVSHQFHSFEVYYQPIVSGDTFKVSGAEALLRWKSHKYGMVSPLEFIPVLEETGLIVPVGKWVLHTALIQCKEWQKVMPDFRINVNLSYIQLKQSDVSSDLVKGLEKCNLDSKYVMLELTESGRVEKDSAVRHMIKHLQKMKVKLAIDDFGTGYSNFCYLKDLKVYIIKIDRSFVSNSLSSEYQFKLLSHIINMAHSVQLKVCIEGIENEAELKRIAELHPDFIQGYFFGKPANAQSFYKESLMQDCK